MTEAEKIKTAKEVIAENIEYGECGIFFTRNMFGDKMYTLYDNAEHELQIDIAQHYNYFEIFGLEPDEEKEIEEYYRTLQKKIRGDK